MQAKRESIRRIMMAIGRIDAAYYDIVRSFGVKDNAFVLFYAIADGKPYSQKRICQDWSVSRSTINTIVMEYVQKGCIQLVPSGHKEKEIVLTEAGREFAKRFLEPIFQAEAEALKAYADADFVEQLENCAEALESNFSKIKTQA